MIYNKQIDMGIKQSVFIGIHTTDGDNSVGLAVGHELNIYDLSLYAKAHLCHLLSIGFGIEGSFGEKDGVFFRSNSQLIVESVMPDLLHVIPVCDDSVFDGILESEDSSLGLSLISHIRVLLSHTDHDTLIWKQTFSIQHKETLSSISPYITKTRT
jgi:hypothetical protein